MILNNTNSTKTWFIYISSFIFHLKFNLENVTVERLEDILEMIKRFDMTPLRYNFGLIHTGVRDLGALKHDTCLKLSLMRNYLWNGSRTAFLFLIKRLLPAWELIPLTYASVIAAFIRSSLQLIFARFRVEIVKFWTRFCVFSEPNIAEFYVLWTFQSTGIMAVLTRIWAGITISTYCQIIVLMNKFVHSLIITSQNQLREKLKNEISFSQTTCFTYTTSIYKNR